MTVRHLISSLAAVGLHGRTTTLRGRLFHGAFWVTAGSVFARLSGFATTVIVARILGKEAFGEYGMVRSTIDMFVVLGAVRMGTTATKYVAQYRATDPHRAERILAMSMTMSLISSLVMMVLLWGFAPWLATHSLSRSSLAPALAIGALFLFFSTYATVTEFALSGFESFQKLAAVHFLRGLLMPATAIALSYRFGLKGLLAAITFNAFVEVVVALGLLRAESLRHQIRTRFSLQAIPQEWPILVHFALPGVLAGLLTAGGIWTANALFVNQPNGYAHLGLFNAANQWKTLILFLPDIISRVILPIMSSAQAGPDQTQFSKAAALNLRVNLMIALPLAMTVIVFRDYWMLLFGERFRGSADVLPFLMISAFAATLTHTVNNTLTSAAKRWFTLIGTVIWATLLCGLVGTRTVPMTPAGLALAYAVSYTVYFVAVTIYAELALPGRVALRQWRWLALSFGLLVLAGVCPGFGKGWPASLLALILLGAASAPVIQALAARWQAVRR